jgi:tRNA(Ile)-lysidine synthase
MYAVKPASALEDDFVRALTKLTTLPVTQTGPIGLAVSGGSDSVALLTLAAATRPQHGRALLALTVDHNLRPESAREAAEVARIANALGVAHQTLRWDMPVARQSAARMARYACLSNALEAAGGMLLLTGHTQDDQAETCLMRAGRGSGGFGLSGIQPIHVNPSFAAGAVAILGRPLLKQSRQSLRADLVRRAMPWIDDPSNQNPVFERVRAREALAASPGLAAQILEDANRYGAERRRDEGIVGAWLAVVPRETGEGFAFRSLPVEVPPAQRALAWLIQLLSGQATRPARDAVGRLEARLRSPESFAGATLGNVRFRLTAGEIILTREAGTPPPEAHLNRQRLVLSEVLQANAVTLL